MHLAIALPLAYFLNIWADEGSTLYTTQHGFFQTFQNTLHDEKQAPLYFLLLSIWREINSSIFFARLFSIICSLLAIGVFYDISRKLWSEKAAVFAGLLFAVHPYLFWASLEIRVYSLVILFSAVLVKLFLEVYLEPEGENSSSPPGYLFTIVAILSLYTNYYLGFILVAFFIVLLCFGRFKEAKRYFLQMMVVGAAILPLLWAIKMQFSVNTGGHFQATDPIEGLRILWGHFLTFVLPTELHPPESQTFASLLRIWVVRILCLAIPIILIARRRLFERRIWIFGIITAVNFAFLYFAYFMLSGIYISNRHAAVLFLPMGLFITAVLRELAANSSKKLRVILLASIAIVLTISYSYALFALYPNLTKRGDWERVAAFVEKNEKSDQPIIVFTNYEALNLPYYYKGKNQILPKENFFKWNYEAEFGTVGTWSKQIEYVISIIPKDAAEIWLLTESGCQKTNGCLPLEKYIDANYTVVVKKDFYKERVRLLKKK
ncbi:MAG: glycosyltransferase family 39 protein [Acidobacteria bacterium]|nr:glycosyltransferase family 39 protein [Acidobacteriota bacterium]